MADSQTEIGQFFRVFFFFEQGIPFPALCSSCYSTEDLHFVIILRLSTEYRDTVYESRSNIRLTRRDDVEVKCDSPPSADTFFKLVLHCVVQVPAFAGKTS